MYRKRFHPVPVGQSTVRKLLFEVAEIKLLPRKHTFRVGYPPGSDVFFYAVRHAYQRHGGVFVFFGIKLYFQKLFRIGADGSETVRPQTARIAGKSADTSRGNYLPDTALGKLSGPPDLIITDSQAFGKVWESRPEGCRVTSFSILLAAYKGDIQAFITGAEALDRLAPDSHILIAEACTHVPASEDIGRVKIPEMLKRHFGNGLKIDTVSGNDFHNDLSGYDLVIHCGACMFNRKYVLDRVRKAERQGVPITNYGMAIAWAECILDKVTIPGR